jgi:hypothetical protein
MPDKPSDEVDQQLEYFLKRVTENQAPPVGGTRPMSDDWTRPITKPLPGPVPSEAV